MSGTHVCPGCAGPRRDRRYPVRPPGRAAWKQQPDLVGSEERRAQKGDRHGQSWGQGAPRRPIPGPQPAAHAVACLRLSPAGRIRRPHSTLPAGTRSPARHPVGERGAPRVFSVVRGQVTRHHRLPELLSCSPFWGRGPGWPQAAVLPARWGSAAVLLMEQMFRMSLGPRHWLRAGGSASEACCDRTARTLGYPPSSPPAAFEPPSPSERMSFGPAPRIQSPGDEGPRRLEPGVVSLAGAPDSTRPGQKSQLWDLGPASSWQGRVIIPLLGICTNYLQNRDLILC